MADDDLIDILSRRFQRVDRQIRDRSPLDRSAKYGNDQPDVTEILDDYADDIYTELATKAAVTYVDSQDTTERNARIAADNALDSRLTTAEGNLTNKAWTTYVDQQDTNERNARTAQDQTLADKDADLQAQITDLNNRLGKLQRYVESFHGTMPANWV